MRRGAAYRFVAYRKADQLPLGIDAEAFKCFIVCGAQIKQIYLAGGILADRLKIWAIARENFPWPGKLRFQPTVRSNDLAEAESMDCRDAEVCLVARLQLFACTLLYLLHGTVRVGDAADSSR